MDTEVSASNIKVKEHLKDLENELNREINHINQMSMRISEIVTLYDNTEKVIAKIAKNGEVKDTYQFHTGREIEGIAVANNRLYTNLAQRAELLESSQTLTK